MIQAFVNMQDRRELRRLAREYPRETYRGMGRAAAVVRGKLRKVMRSGGGVEGVPKFEPANQATILARREMGTRVRKIGGVLSKASAIQMYREGRGTLVVGFITALKPYARMLQDAESRPMKRGEKLRFFRMGIDVREYWRPAREIIRPFTKETNKLLVRLAIKLTRKILAKKR